MCEHGFVGPCGECDGSGQQSSNKPVCDYCDDGLFAPDGPYACGHCGMDTDDVRSGQA